MIIADTNKKFMKFYWLMKAVQLIIAKIVLYIVCENARTVNIFNPKYMTRKQLLEALNNNAPISSHDYHTSEEITEVLQAVLSDYGNMTDEIKDVEDLYNDLWNECDSKTPIYNDDLLEWFKSNYTAVDDYRRETDGASDSILKLIMQAYCWTLQQDAMDALQTLYSNTSEALNQ